MNMRCRGYLVPAVVLSAGLVAAEPLAEHKGRVKGSLVGRIEVYQGDGALHVAFAENRADGAAIMTRGNGVWKLAGRWRACHHGEKASYCQLEGSHSVYRFDNAMFREDRSQPTYLLAATGSGYAARVTTPNGDVLIHRTGGADKVLVQARVAEAWSTGRTVGYMADESTLRSCSLTGSETVDFRVSGALVGNTESGNSASWGDGYECRQTGQRCGEGAFATCFVTDYSCQCVDSSKGCQYGYTYSYSAMYCPDPRVDEPTCGSPGCGPGSVSFSDGLMSVATMCDGAVFAFQCDLAAGNGPDGCYSLPPLTAQTQAPPDIQVTTTPVTFAGRTLAAGTAFTVHEQPSGDVYIFAR